MTDYPECPMCGHIQDREIFLNEEETEYECEHCGSSLSLLMQKSFEVFHDQDALKNDEY